MATEPAHHDERNGSKAKADRDLVGLGIVIATILLFVANGSSVIADFITSMISGGKPRDQMLSTALLLNIALLLFGWRRYADLTSEVGQRREAEEMAHKLARTDPLTGCLNRRSIGGALQDIIATARLTGHEVVAMMIDLDNFKRSNDVHGHQAGDAVLLEAARRIRSVLPERSIIARLGGDEFACAAIYDPDHAEAIDRLVLRINEAVARPVEADGISLEVTASIGLAATTIGEKGDPSVLADTLMHRADLAMYQAKKAGRNRYCWFEPSMESELRYRSELERGIREGVPRGEFVPYYEKQIDLDTGELSGFEMLARWRSPDHGLLSPEVFIPIAEEIGLISDLSESLIRQALNDAREWDPNLTLSVNISPIQLRDPWFAQKLLKLLVEANFPPHRLDIEITETCLHENLGVVRTLITSLKNQGIRISLDDFGTGYSSLAQLRTLPFDRIKIDRFFVSNLGQSKDSAMIIEAISSLGKGMELPITAEGIESAEVLAELRKFGSFKGQGFLYGQPSDASSVRTMLADQNLLRDKTPEAMPETPALPRSATA
ncbi:EAL domain-containing protein [Novosphingobium sp. MMS21-SN21R]|uniref:putative bifunctional diguanylate cyclase/phosphodiesterase n=1 Tax=Novosphingobium sp. MMS21-SN21R TaxID=2969298 RepID=UPI0028857B20|nr:EAL domain-containing protein [Novosphingobium sp. MMS21-SN21R]MDT0507595.1 EAL domain-containing protein [Novosphingobium sp. MMS21-SN21R]